MEKDFILELDELMNRSDITGVICCDSNGLPLAVRGVAKESYSGAISTIVAQAEKLFPSSKNETPTICLESDGSNLLVRRQDKVVVGIFKEKN